MCPNRSTRPVARASFPIVAALESMSRSERQWRRRPRDTGGSRIRKQAAHTRTRWQAPASSIAARIRTGSSGSFGFGRTKPTHAHEQGGLPTPRYRPQPVSILLKMTFAGCDDFRRLVLPDDDVVPQVFSHTWIGPERVRRRQVVSGERPQGGPPRGQMGRGHRFRRNDVPNAHAPFALPLRDCGAWRWSSTSGSVVARLR